MENRIKESRFPDYVSNGIRRPLYGQINPSAVMQLFQGSWVPPGEGHKARYLLLGIKYLLDLSVYQMVIPKFRIVLQIFLMNTLRAVSKICLIRFKHNIVIKFSGCLVGKLVLPTFNKGLDTPIWGHLAHELPRRYIITVKGVTEIWIECILQNTSHVRSLQVLYKDQGHSINIRSLYLKTPHT
jgi:hypothetical protein